MSAKKVLIDDFVDQLYSFENQLVFAHDKENGSRWLLVCTKTIFAEPFFAVSYKVVARDSEYEFDTLPDAIEFFNWIGEGG